MKRLQFAIWFRPDKFSVFSRMFEKLFNNAGFLQNLSKFVSSKYASVGQSEFDFVDGMFPRVYKQSFDIELTIFGRDEAIDPEFLENVVDKFLRVIDPFVEESKMFSVRIYNSYKYQFITYFLHFYRDEMIGRKSGEGWLWELKTTIFQRL